jgi:hypothetical protein
MSTVITDRVFAPVATSVLHERQFQLMLDRATAKPHRRSHSEKNSVAHKGSSYPLLVHGRVGGRTYGS